MHLLILRMEHISYSDMRGLVSMYSFLLNDLYRLTVVIDHTYVYLVDTKRQRKLVGISSENK